MFTTLPPTVPFLCHNHTNNNMTCVGPTKVNRIMDQISFSSRNKKPC